MKESDPSLLGNRNIASIGGKFIADHREKRTFAGTVGTDNSGMFPLFHPEGSIVENVPCPVTLKNVFKIKLLMAVNTNVKTAPETRKLSGKMRELKTIRFFKTPPKAYNTL